MKMLCPHHSSTFPLECANRNVQAIQEGLKMNGTYQLLVYAGDVHLLGKNVHNIQKNRDVLLVTSSKMES
jgi:hypothetical protein